MKKISAILTVLVGLVLIPACEKKGGEAEEVKGDFFELISGASSSYTVVYPVDASDQVKKDAASLRAAIFKATGVKLGLADDSASASGHEIVVGTTTRSATATAMAKFPDDYSYAISRVGEDVVIAASDEDILSYALYDFDKNVLSQKTRARDGMLRIEAGDFKVKSLGCPLTIKHLMGTRMYYKLDVKEFASSGASPDAVVALTQGAAADGENMYFAFRDNADNGAGGTGVWGLIVKNKITEKGLERVGATEKFVGGHANSMAYCDEDGLLYLVAANNSGGIVRVDPKTMKVVDTKYYMPVPTAITYNKEQKKFMMRSGSTLIVSDATLSNTLVSVKRTDGSQYVTQGVGSDDMYCYFPMSPSSANGTADNNQLLVYDWNGNFIQTIMVDLPYESEDMFTVGSRYFINFAGSKAVGHRVYELVITDYFYRTKLSVAGTALLDE